MPVMSRIMNEHNLINSIMDKFIHDISSEVEYKYLHRYLHNIFPRPTLQRAEGRDRANYDIMVKICDSARTLSMETFLKFLDTIRRDYEHVYDAINTYCVKETGNNLSSYESAPMTIQNGSSFTQNAPIHTQNAQIPLQNASISPQNVPSASQNALTPQHYVSVSPHNASPISQNAESLEPNLNTAGFMDLCDPNEMATPETYHSSQSVSSLSAETTEQNTASGNINYTSFGPACPCPSEQVSPHDNEVSLGSSEQLPGSSLVSYEAFIGSGAVEASSSDPNNLASRKYDAPPEAAVLNREESSELRKYNKLINKNPNSVYKMESLPRGHCVIINNESFQHLSYRRGSSKDVENLKRMFKVLGFEVLLYQNKTAREMKNLLEEFASKPALDQILSLAVVILSHGGPNDSIYGQDGAVAEGRPVAGTFITKLDLQYIFNGTNCPSMNGKPKLFILQACRGEEEDDCDRSNSNDLEESEDQHGSNYCRDSDTSLDHTREPVTESDYPFQEPRAETADMCFLHSSSSGYKAYRSPSRGSPFVQLFTEKVIQHGQEKSLQNIVVLVQDEFSKRIIVATKMTMPEYSSSLTKKWYLNPPCRDSSMISGELNDCSRVK